MVATTTRKVLLPKYKPMKNDTFKIFHSYLVGGYVRYLSQVKDNFIKTGEA